MQTLVGPSLTALRRQLAFPARRRWSSLRQAFLFGIGRALSIASLGFGH